MNGYGAQFANITRGESGYGIGAMVKLAAIAENEERRQFPSSHRYAAQIGGPQIRNMGTLAAPPAATAAGTSAMNTSSACSRRAAGVSPLTARTNTTRSSLAVTPCVIVNLIDLAPHSSLGARPRSTGQAK